MKPITVWFKLNYKTNEFEHNHIEDGHVGCYEPTPLNEEQKKAWKGAKWQYAHRFITDEKEEKPDVLIF